MEAPGDQRSGDMPAAIRKMIVRSSGRAIVLVEQKELYATDVNKNNNRLSMPQKALKV